MTGRLKIIKEIDKMEKSKREVSQTWNSAHDTFDLREKLGLHRKTNFKRSRNCKENENHYS